MSSTSLSKNMFFCVACRQRTPTKNLSQHRTRTNRLIVKGTCTVCGRKKATFVSQGKGIVNTLLNSGILPELHLPGHNYTGPGTNLKKRLLAGDKPVNKLDAAAQQHDMAYAIFDDKKDRHVFDKKLQQEAQQIMFDPQSSWKEKAEAGLVAGTMLAKRKLGAGQKIN